MGRLINVAIATLFWVGIEGQALAQNDALTVTDGTQTVELSKEQLGQLKQETIETTTTWTEGKTTFSGPSFADVLDAAGLAGETVNGEALDGYSIDIPRERLTADGAILATSMNGEPLPEDKGTYWIIFPYDQSPEIGDDDHRSWSIWALTKLTLK